MVIDVAPVFGTLDAKTVKELDDNVIVIIAGMTKAIAQIPVKDRTYEKIVELFSQSPLVKMDGKGTSKSDSLIKNDQAQFKTDGSPDAAIVKEVADWFQRFVKDQEILDATNIDINVLGRIVAQSGATVKDPSTIFHAKEHAEKSLDVAGIRYPEPNRPKFSIFRIHLTAWSDSDQMYETSYVPREELMSGLRDEVRQKAIETGKTLFDE
ncbi:hypothetical protein NW768_011219 [Fusarium equiseti]|uniref:Uncharacterized protein n=1 Tax=Fusarium equiseti TaxID=61235 RepID=A0ABQ8QYA1_FUSEQ|nr:hypothetical protein NW768_011219 [Fusarium equiseti]